MVSAGFARPNAHHYPTPGLTHSQSNTQYLKEAYGLSGSPTTNLVGQNVMPNENEWPSLNNAMFGGLDQHDRALSQQRGLGRRPMNPPMQPMRRPASSIGRVGVMPQGMSAIHHQMNAAQQQQLQQQKQAQQQAQINNGAAKNPKLYKTELCRSWADTGTCNYGERCQFAHGTNDKRPIPRHPKYKTEACQSYHQTGYCAYGSRCHFIHNEETSVLAEMVAANAAASASKQQLAPMQQQQSPIRPNNLFTGPAAAVGSVCSSSPTFGSPQRGPPVMSLGPIGSNNTNSPNAIARVASLSAPAYNPNFFSHQFQTQLQIFNDGVKTSNTAGNATPTPVTGFDELGGSIGDSPIPSSNDSGTESPICSFSPGSELDDPAFFFARKQLEATKSVGPKLQTSVPFNLLPSLLNSDVESEFSSSSSTSSNVGTKSLNSPVIGSPPYLASTPSSTIWSNGSVGTPTSGAARLPVFERLSNGP